MLYTVTGEFPLGLMITCLEDPVMGTSLYYLPMEVLSCLLSEYLGSRWEKLIARCKQAPKSRDSSAMTRSR